MNIEILLEDFCHYSTFIRGYSPYTIRRYRHMVGFYIKYAGISQISEVTQENINQFFINGRAKRGWLSNTYVNYHKTLLVFFRWAIKQGHMTENYVADIELPRIEKRLPSKLKKDEAMRILEVAYNYPYKYKFLKYRNHAIFSMFIFAGLRKGELLNLKYTDVDLENLTLFVRQGKGNKDRIIPMSYTLAQTLNRYLLERKRLKKTCPEFFTSLNRDSGFTDSGLKRLIVKIKKTSRIEFSSHKLRHTFATLMLEGGCDIYSLSKMMGHSDIKTTTIYLSASAEHLRSQVTKHPLNTH